MNAYLNDIRRINDFTLPWEQLSGANILVTGATGLIGSALVDALMLHAGRDYHVYAAGRNEQRAQVRFADYLAASPGSPKFFASNPVEVMKAKLMGGTHLMEYGLAHDMRRFVYVSSGEVYGECADVPFTEQSSGYLDCTNPRACYPSSKRAAETLCVAYAAEYGADVVIARPCHTYGPCFTESDNRAYAQFIRRARAGEDIVLKSPGLQMRSWCYVVDAVSALLHILLKGESRQAYNVADDTSNLTIRQLAEHIAAIGGCQVRFDVDEALMRQNDIISRAVFDVTRLRSLGWHPIADIEHNLRSSVHE